MSRAAVVAVCVGLAAGCAGLPSPEAEAPATYLLDARPAVPPAATRRDLVLAVGVPRARAGYDSAQIAFVRRPYELEYFAKSRWTDPPARLLAPLMVLALDASGGFRSVVPVPAGVAPDLRLDTELIRLQQDFGASPSRVEIALRVQLIDVRANRVLAEALLEATETAPSEDAYGGVIAANRALERLLPRVVDFAVARAGER
jgi:cholesterol transport system auxiliary component